MNKLIDKSSKIYIAGHNGMVGKAICRNLKLQGYKNILTASRSSLDLRDINLVKDWFQTNQPNVTILAAAKVGGILANQTFPADFILDNLKIQNNIIETSMKNNVKRLLFLGSSCIYPKYSTQPIKEEELLSGSLEPTNEWYAIAKISGIKLCDALRQQFNFDAISLMPTNLYGPGDNYNLKNSHVLPALIRKFYNAKINKSEQITLWGSGKPMREFLHVDDLAKACIFALEYWDPQSILSPKTDTNKSLLHLNVGTGIDISIKDLANLISSKIGFNGIINWDKSKPDGTPKKQLDITRIKQLGWQPSISLDEGIDNTIAAFKEELNSKNLRI
ncbi:GDP-fucose synthetase [bacterium]|nr:GDP-fucose synthetase [bacterium]|tara:strand:+ start:1375 stop:2373 length:999 start_codon:yes stop_codon:yes gene_type:complete